MENDSKNLILPASILIAAILISYSLFQTRGNKVEQNPVVDQPAYKEFKGSQDILALNDRDVVLGDPSAKVTVIEYADYQCPFCERFYANVTPEIKKDYIDSGKVKFVYRNYILIDKLSGGNESQLSAEAAECAKDQGKFWEYHDALYTAEGKDGKEANGNLNRSLFLSLASKVGLNTTDFAKCYDSHAHKNEIVSQSEAMGNIGTPTVLVNKLQLSGVDPSDPYGQYKAAIEYALKAR